MDSKWFVLSKTMWLNAGSLLLLFAVEGVNTNNLESALGSLGLAAAVPMINILLRFFKTHEGIGSNGTKTFWGSWTFWFNVILVILGGVLIYFGSDLVLGIALIIYGAVNVWLRFASDKGLRLFPWKV